jgi:hypothetical protein
MRIWTRRRALERLGLGAAAPLLSSVAGTLVSDVVRGAPAARRCFVVMVVGEAIPLSPPFVPPGVSPGDTARWSAEDRAGITLPEAYQPLDAYRSKIVIVDGLANDLAGRLNHGTSFGALSGIRPDAPTDNGGGRPSAITIDQHVAAKIGAATAERSLLLGLAGDGAVADESANTFAAGAGQPLANVGRPSLLYARVAGVQAPMAMASSSPSSTSPAMRLGLLDSTRDEVKRLQAALAGPERVKLDAYLQAMDQFGRKQQQLAQVTASSSCRSYPTALDGRPEDRLRSMVALAALALRCGLTNVVGVSIGHGNQHDDMRMFRGGLFPGDYGAHGPPDLYQASMVKMYRFASELLAALLDASGVADSIVAAMVPGTGVSLGTYHHGFHQWRNPTLVYDGTGTLRTGGRYLRRARGALPDLYCSLAHAAGAPIDSFGTGGVNKISGPIPELMA